MHIGLEQPYLRIVDIGLDKCRVLYVLCRSKRVVTLSVQSQREESKPGVVTGSVDTVCQEECGDEHRDTLHCGL